jgi:cytochrome c-type biogenesis protein CcmH
MSRSISFALLAMVAMVALAGAAWGLSGEALDRRVREISDGLRCPTCQSISVNDSEAAFSRQIRAKVRRMLEEGQREQQIKAFFVSRYGEWILRAPKKEGLGLVLWLLPGLLMAGVGAWIGIKVHKSARAGRGGAADTQPLGKAERERVERDLRRFEEED